MSPDDSHPMNPAQQGGAATLLSSPDRFYNRELSWVQFNHRVLEESRNPNYPLFERVRFLSIG